MKIVRHYPYSIIKGKLDLPMINHNVIKRCGMSFLAGLLLLLTSCPHSQQNEFKDHVNRISLLYEQAKYNEALVSCDELINKYPESPFGYGMKGIILNSTYRPKQALDSLKKELSRLSSKDYEGRALVFEQIAQTFVNLNDLDNAMDYFKRARLEDYELYSTIMFDVARVYLLKGDIIGSTDAYVEAKDKIEVSDKDLQQINKRNSGNIYAKAAFIAFQLHKDNEALNFAVKYHEIKNNNKSKFILSTYFARMGQIDKAKVQFNAVNLEHIDALELSEYYLYMDDIPHTIDAFDKSYKQQISSEQVTTWKLELQRKWPRDIWKDVRSQEWFKNKFTDN